MNVSTSPDVSVRRATPADATDIVRLALEVQAVHVAGRPDIFKPGGGEPKGTIADRISSVGQLYWIATVDEKAVGYAYARVVEEPESLWRHAARTLVLDQMGVDARLRSHGIGQALWNAVRDAARAEGVDRVLLNVWAFNRDARRFYERLGFASFHERMELELDDPDRSAR